MCERKEIITYKLARFETWEMPERLTALKSNNNITVMVSKPVKISFTYYAPHEAALEQILIREGWSMQSMSESTETFHEHRHCKSNQQVKATESQPTMGSNKHSSIQTQSTELALASGSGDSKLDVKAEKLSVDQAPRGLDQDVQEKPLSGTENNMSPGQTWEGLGALKRGGKLQTIGEVMPSNTDVIKYKGHFGMPSTKSIISTTGHKLEFKPSVELISPVPVQFETIRQPIIKLSESLSSLGSTLSGGSSKSRQRLEKLPLRTLLSDPTEYLIPSDDDSDENVDRKECPPKEKIILRKDMKTLKGFMRAKRTQKNESFKKIPLKPEQVLPKASKAKQGVLPPKVTRKNAAVQCPQDATKITQHILNYRYSIERLRKMKEKYGIEEKPNFWSRWVAQKEPKKIIWKEWKAENEKKEKSVTKSDSFSTDSAYINFMHNKGRLPILFQPRTPEDFSQKLYDAIHDFTIRKEQVTFLDGSGTKTSITINRILPCVYGVPSSIVSILQQNSQQSPMSTNTRLSNLESSHLVQGQTTVITDTEA